MAVTKWMWRATDPGIHFSHVALLRGLFHIHALSYFWAGENPLRNKLVTMLTCNQAPKKPYELYQCRDQLHRSWANWQLVSTCPPLCGRLFSSLELLEDERRIILRYTEGAIADGKSIPYSLENSTPSLPRWDQNWWSSFSHSLFCRSSSLVT